jgi:hypothetical protein
MSVAELLNDRLTESGHLVIMVAVPLREQLSIKETP